MLSSSNRWKLLFVIAKSLIAAIELNYILFAWIKVLIYSRNW